MRIIEVVVLKVCKHLHLKVYDLGVVIKKIHRSVFEIILLSQSWAKNDPQKLNSCPTNTEKKKYKIYLVAYSQYTSFRL